jgi:hypothetical protein
VAGAIDVESRAAALAACALGGIAAIAALLAVAYPTRSLAAGLELFQSSRQRTGEGAAV